MIALTGRNFCSAGAEALCLLIRSADRVYVTHHLGGIIEFIGSLFVTAGMTTYSYYYFTECNCDIKNITTSPVVPMIIVGIVSYMIGRIFMCLYAMGVDCILLCYLVDCEVNNGAQNTPPTLRHFIEEYQ